MSMDTYFQILGVEQKWHLAASELEARYHEKNKLVHPDRHAKADSQTRVRNALATSNLNQAYRTLKDPIQRAEYLLKLEGIELSDERSGHKVAPEFLVEIMELREGLMDARTEGDKAKVSALAAAVRGRRDAVLGEVDTGFTRYESGDRAVLGQIADALVAERYFRRFLDEAEAFLDAE